MPTRRPSSHRRPWIFPALGAALAAVAAAVAAPLGCSSGGCDPSECAAGNECIDDGHGPACHLACTSEATCPFNYTCNDARPKSFCVENTKTFAQGQGQWGAACVPSGGEQGNPACDAKSGFACYGTSPTDATSFCTVIGCAADSDCPGGWWCAEKNVAPNVTTDKPSFGATRLVCVPRSYCSPCKVDHDCPATADGTTQHCVADKSGSTYCAPQCANSANCAIDSVCTRWRSTCEPRPADAGGPAVPPPGTSCASDDDCPPAAGIAQHCSAGQCHVECGADGDCAPTEQCSWVNTCAPRAGACVGAGGFCSPCRSDADCPSGFCMSAAPYSTERFCSAAATVARCSTSTPEPEGCPAPAPTDNWKAVGCTTAPANQCVGFVTFGTSSGNQLLVPGCWSANR